ncbi:MAG: integration host factor subunit alpha [Rickettsiales bacterium]|jgi:integration host factor subunit alpha|nr:integration host factor subunit alpha [Rickettsiales bacterium]
MSTITRADFAENIRRTAGLSAAESYKLVDLFFTEISESLIRGEEVKVSGLGTFKILHKKERMGRNPKTGEPAVISARRIVSFKPNAEFRRKVAGK